MKIAITSTVRGIDEPFRSWCEYHLGLVDHLIIWIDDPVELGTQWIPRDPRILRNIGSQSSLQSVHGSMMQRQTENADNAMRLCNELGVEWLAHIDSDELLYFCKVAAKASILQANRSVGQIAIPNHEVCPIWDARNPFVDCRYFKVNGKTPFRYYSNGKALVRCGPDVRACDAHRFVGFVGETVVRRDVCVLHYACPTYDIWMRKYANLGAFPDGWWDDPTRPIALTHHLESRDIYLRCRERGHFAEARDFYLSHIMSTSEIHTMVEKGDVIEIFPFSHSL